jgi:hypothetical protein
MFVPAFVTELATSTPIYEGTPLVGGGPLPGPVTKFVPHEFAGLCVGRGTSRRGRRFESVRGLEKLRPQVIRVLREVLLW